MIRLNFERDELEAAAAALWDYLSKLRATPESDESRSQYGAALAAYTRILYKLNGIE